MTSQVKRDEKNKRRKKEKGEERKEKKKKRFPSFQLRNSPDPSAWASEFLAAKWEEGGRSREKEGEKKGFNRTSSIFWQSANTNWSGGGDRKIEKKRGGKEKGESAQRHL